MERMEVSVSRGNFARNEPSFIISENLVLYKLGSEQNLDILKISHAVRTYVVKDGRA